MKERLDSSEKDLMAETDEHLNVKRNFLSRYFFMRLFDRNLQAMVYEHFV